MLLKSKMKTPWPQPVRVVYNKKRASVKFLPHSQVARYKSENYLPYKSFLFSLDDQKLARTVWAEPEYKTLIKEASVD